MRGTGIHLKKRLSRAGKTTLIGVLAAIMSWVVLFGTLQAALSVPTEERLSPLARAGALDYSAGPVGSFASLRDAFIADVLGLELSTPPGTAGSPDDGSILAAPSPPTPIAPIPGRLPRTIVEHHFDNDDFDDAYAIPTIPFTGKTDTRAAERERGEPDTCEPAGGTVWYRYRPSRDIALLANSFGSDHAIALAAFRGQDLHNLTLVDCDVNAAGNAQVVFPAKKKHFYYFRVTAPVAGGDLVFSLDPLGTTSLVSVAHDGKSGGNGNSWYASVSADGRYVAFHSNADNLVRRPEKKTCTWSGHSERDCQDIYVRDTVTGRTHLLSKNSRGVSSNGISKNVSISGDGRFAAFYSIGDNLVPGDTNRFGDVFVHDRRTGKTERVSVSSDGDEGRSPHADTPQCAVSPSIMPEYEQGRREHCANAIQDFLGVGISISSDGRYVTFATSLHGLVEPEPPHCTDITSQDYGLDLNHGRSVPVPVDVGDYSCRHVYVHDRRTDETRLVSVSSAGEPGVGDSAAPFVSRNGHWIVFSSSAPNLVEGDTNDYRDVFLHDLRTSTTELVSVSAFGQQADAQSGGTNNRGHMSVSDDGRWVAFITHASNLTEDHVSHMDSLFLKDMRSGEVIPVSSAPDDASPLARINQRTGYHAVISADGNYIAFTEQLANRDTGSRPLEVYLFDRATRTITLISVSTSGATSGRHSREPEISADGHFVVFHSGASNFDRRDEDVDEDVYIHALPWTR